MALRSIEYRPLDEVDNLRAERNAKGHDAPGIAASIGRFGFVAVPEIDERTGRLVAGHGRLDALLEAQQSGDQPPDGIDVDESGGWLVPLVRGWSSVDDDEADAYAIAANQLPIAGGWQPDVLQEQLRQLEAAPLSHEGLGFQPAELGMMLADLATPIETHRPTFASLTDLQPHERNYRGHPDDQLAHLEASLNEHGFYRNIVVARDGTILAGHGIVEAARRRGLVSVPVVRLDIEPDSPEALKILAGDNEIAGRAEVDDRSLSEMLREIAATADGYLVGTGLDEMMLANLALVTRSMSELATFDAAAEWVGMPEFVAPAARVLLLVAFDSETDRDKLIEQLGLTTKKSGVSPTLSAWWPPRERNDLKSVQWQQT